MAGGDHPAVIGELLAALRERGWTLAVAEADTGGLLLAWLTAGPGSSTVVLGGVVAYHDELKRSLVSVPAEALAAQGAVSRATAEAMAAGIRARTGADVGLATTGIAGPGGGTPSKPVGLAWVAVAHPRGLQSRQYRWSGGREENRRASALAVVELALAALGGALERPRPAGEGRGMRRDACHETAPRQEGQRGVS